MSKYTVNKDIKSESSGLNFMDVGIHENCELKKVVYDVSDKGSEFLVFHFEDEKGKQLAHTEYKASDDNPEVLKNKELNQLKRIKHIATKFVTEDEFTFSADSFKELCEKTIKVLGTTFIGKKVRLKIIYSWNNYTSLPKYVPFIEKMDIPKDKSNLDISSIDKMTKDRPDERPSRVENPFETSDDLAQEPKVEVSGDGLPF
jgi:hypothetical protein